MHRADVLGKSWMSTGCSPVLPHFMSVSSSRDVSNSPSTEHVTQAGQSECFILDDGHMTLTDQSECFILEHGHMTQADQSEYFILQN